MFSFARRAPLLLVLPVLFSIAVGPLNPQTVNHCDLDKNGVVNSADVQLMVAMAKGEVACTAAINGASVCDAVALQRVVNAYLGAQCLVTNFQHFVVLEWTKSSTPWASLYTVHRSMTSGEPYIKQTIPPIPGNKTAADKRWWADLHVASGVTYFYVVTALGYDPADGQLKESTSYSPEVSATIPTP